MLVYEHKLDGNQQQFAAIEEVIRVVQFIRNKCVRLWIDGDRVNKNDLQTYCAALAKAFPFASKLNSQARQASADRAWFAIDRFYTNCREHKPGKKGYPQFQHNNRSVEYKQTGWKLDDDGKHITFTDGCGIGRLRLVGNKKQHIETFPVKAIKRVRIVRRADGYYCQFCVKTERKVEHVPSGTQLGIDVGLKSFLTDSEGNTVDNPRHYRKTEKKLKRLGRRLSRKQKKSANRKKARKALAKQHLNAGWGIFLHWLARYGFLHDIPVIAVAPHYTSQQCSDCGTIVKKSLSIRTHICHGCGVVLDRDHNAACNILEKALSSIRGCTGGHSETDRLAL